MMRMVSMKVMANHHGLSFDLDDFCCIAVYEILDWLNRDRSTDV